MTPDAAKEIMERGGFSCEIVDGCVPIVKLPTHEKERVRLIELAGTNELACHIYEARRLVVLVPVKATIQKTREIMRDQLL